MNVRCELKGVRQRSVAAGGRVSRVPVCQGVQGFRIRATRDAQRQRERYRTARRRAKGVARGINSDSTMPRALMSPPRSPRTAKVVGKNVAMRSDGPASKIAGYGSGY